MWIKKTDEEIQDVLRIEFESRKKLTKPLLIGAIFSVIFAVIYSIGFRGGARGFYFFSSPTNIFSQKSLLIGIFGFALFFFIALYLQRKGSSMLSTDNIFLCSKCKEPKHTNLQKLCGCGGVLEPFSFYDWEEEK